MKEIKETAWDHIAGHTTATITAAEPKYINKIKKLKREHPGEVEICVENEDGSIVAHIPEKWLSIRPPKKMNLSPEQRAEASRRMLEMRHLESGSKAGDIST